MRCSVTAHRRPTSVALRRGSGSGSERGDTGGAPQRRRGCARACDGHRPTAFPDGAWCGTWCLPQRVERACLSPKEEPKPHSSRSIEIGRSFQGTQGPTGADQGIDSVGWPGSLRQRGADDGRRACGVGERKRTRHHQASATAVKVEKAHADTPTAATNPRLLRY